MTACNAKDLLVLTIPLRISAALQLGTALSSLFCQTNHNNASSFQIMDSNSRLTSSYKSTVHYLPSTEWQRAKVNKWLVMRVAHLAKQRDPDFPFSGAGRLKYAGLKISEYWTLI